MRSTPSSASCAATPRVDPPSSVGTTRSARRRRRAARELMVVGDADQSIYAFRGANIRNILEFEEDFPDATHDPAGAELPLDADHPQRRQRGDRPQQGPHRKNLWSDAGDGEQIVGYVADDEHDEARFVSEEIDTLTDARRHGPATWRCSTAPTPSPGCSRRCSSASACPTGSSAGCASTSGARSGRARLPADAGQPGRRGLAAPDPQRAQARHRRPGRGLRRGARRARADHASGRRCAAPRRRPGIATRSLTGDPGLRRPGRGAPVDGRRGGAAPTSSSSRCWPAAATSRSSRSPRTRRTRPGWRTSPSSSRWPASSPTSRSPARRPTRPTRRRPAPGLPDFLERVALVADSDQIPDAPEDDVDAAWSR